MGSTLKDPEFNKTRYEDTTEGDARLKSKTAAEQAVAEHKDFTFSKQNDYNTAYQQWMERKPFSYNFNEDALYQQYKDKYIQQGKLAMADTIGQASAMTGGYGNSYAATVGNQAYQASLQNLNDIIPELYQMAYDRYNQQGQDMLNTLSLLGNERAWEYGLDTDKYNKLVDAMNYANSDYYNSASLYGTEQDRANNLAQTEYDNAFSKWQADTANEQWQKTYDLSERELKMSEEAWEFQKSDLQDAKDNKTYSYTGTTSTGSSYNNGGYSDAVVKAAQKFVGTDADGKWGDNSTAKAKAAGYESLADVVAAMGGSVEATSSVPDKVVKQLQNYSTEKGQADYLANQVNNGTITKEQAKTLLNEHGVTDFVNRSWEMVDDGGINWFGIGIDADAKVRDEFNNTYTLKELKKELEKTMSSSEAKKWIKDLENQLGI